jgi:predicted HTH domain antitoxin
VNLETVAQLLNLGVKRVHEGEQSGIIQKNSLRIKLASIPSYSCFSSRQTKSICWRSSLQEREQVLMDKPCLSFGWPTTIACLSELFFYDSLMTITLPDNPALAAMGEAEIRIDLACGAYAAGHLSRQLAADVAGVSRHDFDGALYARRIPSFTEEMLAEDLATLAKLGAR